MIKPHGEIKPPITRRRYYHCTVPSCDRISDIHSVVWLDDEALCPACFDASYEFSKLPLTEMCVCGHVRSQHVNKPPFGLPGCTDCAGFEAAAALAVTCASITQQKVRAH